MSSGSASAPMQPLLPSPPSGRRPWRRLRPNYRTLTPFVDVLYSALLGYGFYEIAEALKRGQFLPVALLSFSILYLIGDYTDARLFSEEYPYKSAARFFYDLGIGVVLFNAFIAATQKSIIYILLMALAFALGGKWCLILDKEYQGKRPLKWPKVVAQSHLYAAVLFLGAWYRIRNQHAMTWLDFFVIAASYLSWAFLVSLAEVMLGIAPSEADLFPNFPIGRILR